MRHGFLLIDKPLGITSHDAVSIIRRSLPERSVGHLGTLDPAASGLLVLAVGSKALKVIELFSDLQKEYVAHITLDAVSTTYDAQGHIEAVTRKPGVPDPDTLSIRRVIKDRFLGTIAQVPPMHSAVHIQGQRAYHLARQGKQVTMPERMVSIEECEIVSFTHPELVLRVRCGSGTYIRSLAHDIGTALRTGAYLSGLRRTKVGKWSVEDALEPQHANWKNVVALKNIVDAFPRIDLAASDVENIRQGRTIAASVEEGTFAWHDGLPIALLRPLTASTARARKVL